MSSKHHKNDKRVRALIAQEAARIIYEQSIQDFRSAKSKACLRLGYGDNTSLPSNAEVQEALQEYIRLFKSQEQAQLSNTFYLAAEQAMKFLEKYNPRLVGAIINGTANENAAIHLHVFAETAEEIILFLGDTGILFEVREASVSYGEGHGLESKLTQLNFIAGNAPIEITIFPINGMRHAPNSPVDGKPMKRLSLLELSAMIVRPVA